MLWDGLLDVAYIYQDVRRAGYLCTPFLRDELVFLVRADKNAFPDGIRQNMSTRALRDVQFFSA